MQSLNNVLLIGAGGRLGSHVLEAFLRSPYRVSILARKESTSVFPEGVPVLKADYDHLPSLMSAMKGQDVVVSMQLAFEDFFLANSALKPKDPNAAELNPIVTPPKAALVDYLKTQEDRLSWTSIITGAFFDWGLKIGFFGFDLATKSATLIDNGTSLFTSTTLPVIAQAIVASLQHAEETKNQYVFICSFNVSQRDILDTIQKVDAQHQWTVKHATSDEVRATGKSRLAEGDFSGIMDLTRSAALGKRALGDHTAYGIWNKILGLPEEDLEQAIRTVI